ncbi:MAG: ArsR/SmtB family transcription factor [Christensenellaceae bacterium]
MQSNEILKIIKALGEETRLQIFEELRGGKLCACKLLERFNISQPTLSHHMRILCESGLVIAKKDWKRTYYSIDCGKLNEVIKYLGDTKCNEKNCR